MHNILCVNAKAPLYKESRSHSWQQTYQQQKSQYIYKDSKLIKSLIQKNDALICIARLRSWQKCLEFTKPKNSDINKRESRYTIKGALILKHVKIKQRFSTYSIVPIKCTVFFSTVTVSKNTVCLIGTIEYDK